MNGFYDGIVSAHYDPSDPKQLRAMEVLCNILTNCCEDPDKLSVLASFLDSDFDLEEDFTIDDLADAISNVVGLLYEIWEL